MFKSQPALALALLLGLVLFPSMTLWLLTRSQRSAPATSTLLSGTDPPIGAPCAVEFGPPLPADITSIYLTGRLKAANDRWLVLFNEDKPAEGEVWIPPENVLLVVSGKDATNYKGINKSF